MESVKEIRKILERFYQGISTLEEEQRLREYFSSTTVSEEMIPDRDLFHVLDQGDETIPVPGDLNQKILESIDQQERLQKRTRRISVYSLSGLAAGLLILIALYVGYFRKSDSTIIAQQMVDTYSDPMEAYEQARKTLELISAKMNEGTSELRHVQKLSQTATEPLQSLSKLNKGTKELSLLVELRKVR